MELTFTAATVGVVFSFEMGLVGIEACYLFYSLTIVSTATNLNHRFKKLFTQLFSAIGLKLCLKRYFKMLTYSSKPEETATFTTTTTSSEGTLTTSATGTRPVVVTRLQRVCSLIVWMWLLSAPFIEGDLHS